MPIASTRCMNIPRQLTRHLTTLGASQLSSIRRPQSRCQGMQWARHLTAPSQTAKSSRRGQACRGSAAVAGAITSCTCNTIDEVFPRNACSQSHARESGSAGNFHPQNIPIDTNERALPVEARRLRLSCLC